MTEQQLLLASAYLDDELNAADRALAENDPAVMELVGQMAAVQQTMQVTTPAFSESTMSSQIRSAIAGAASAHPGSHPSDGQPAPTIAQVVELPQPTATPLPSSNTRWLAFAAGVLAIGLLGALAVSALQSTTKDLSGAAPAATKGPANDQMSNDTASASASDMTVAADGEAAETSAGSEMAPAMDETFASDDQIVITNSADLLEVGRQLLEPGSLLNGAPRPETDCTVEDQDPQGNGTKIPILAEATLVEGSTTKQIFVAAHLTASTSQANLSVYGVDPATCAVLMSTTGHMER